YLLLPKFSADRSGKTNHSRSQKGHRGRLRNAGCSTHRTDRASDEATGCSLVIQVGREEHAITVRDEIARRETRALDVEGQRTSRRVAGARAATVCSAATRCIAIERETEGSESALAVAACTQVAEVILGVGPIQGYRCRSPVQVECECVVPASVYEECVVQNNAYVNAVCDATVLGHRDRAPRSRTTGRCGRTV